MEEDWYNYENDSRFMKIYKEIIDKYSNKLNVIKETRKKKYIHLVLCTIIVVLIIYVGAVILIHFSIPEIRVSLAFLPIYLVFVGLLILSFILTDINGTYSNIRNDELYNFFNDKIVKEIVKGISNDLDKDDKIDDGLYNEFHERFDPYRRKDYYIFANHFFGKKDGVEFEMFNILEDTQYKKHPSCFGYLYSSTEIKRNDSNTIEFSSYKKKELADLDPRIKRIVEEFSKYSARYRVNISENKLMIAIETDYLFYPGSVKLALDPYYLYSQYMFLDFAINLTVKLSQIYLL